MKYHLKDTDAEWAIEAANQESWVLRKKEEDQWKTIGTFRTPNEAAVMAGATRASVSKPERDGRVRRKYILSSWESVAPF
jgi:hypothetical protein